MRPRNKQQPCKTPRCERIASVRGWCFADYQLARKSADFQLVYQTGSTHAIEGAPVEIATGCGVPDCARVVKVRGLCARHYSRFRKYGDPLHLSKKHLPVRTQLPNETSPTRLGKLLGVSRQRADQLLNRQANIARAAVYNALLAGQIVKPKACERCLAKTKTLHAHHWDYREELDVRWLCRKCHGAVHRQIRENKAA